MLNVHRSRPIGITIIAIIMAIFGIPGIIGGIGLLSVSASPGVITIIMGVLHSTQEYKHFSDEKPAASRNQKSSRRGGFFVTKCL